LISDRSNAGLADTLRPLEEQLWRAETRFDDALMDRVFAQDFTEFGRSGRTYTRDQMFFGSKEQPDFETVLPLPEFRARWLSGTIAQTTYISRVRYGDVVEAANRSSIWRSGAAGWQICFHQGTPILA